MRVRVMVLTVLLASSASAVAQTTPAKTTPTRTTPTAAPPASNPKLDGYLKRWETQMRKVQTLSALITRIDKDKVFSTTRKFNGWAQYMKSGSGPTTMNLAALELKPDGKTEIAEKLICTGTYLYQFMPAQKEIRVYDLPKPKPGQVSDDSFLGFLFGMKADDAKKRYTLKLANEDKWYIYVDIVPRHKADLAEFARARLVLNKDSFLPRQLWFEHANGNEVTWDIPRLQSGVVVDRRVFDKPTVPTGWKLVPMRASSTTNSPPPRVIRPSKQPVGPR